MTKRGIIRSVLAMLGLSLALVLISANPSIASEKPSELSAPTIAASCYASGCHGKDPQAQGCSSGATTLQEFTESGYRLELRYSSACYAAWVRVASQGYWSQVGNFRIERHTIPISYFAGSFGSGETGTKWTKMYSFRDVVRGSLEVRNYSTGYHQTFYTRWY